jgi:uncharacterized membrane protein YadS
LPWRFYADALTVMGGAGELVIPAGSTGVSVSAPLLLFSLITALLSCVCLRSPEELVSLFTSPAKSVCFRAAAYAPAPQL